MSTGRCFVDFLSLSEQSSWNTHDCFLSYLFFYVIQRPLSILRYKGQIKQLRKQRQADSKAQASRNTSNERHYREAVAGEAILKQSFFLSSSWVVRIRGGIRVLLINNNTAAWQVESRAGPRNLLCSAGNFDKMGSAGDQHEVQHTEWGMDKYTYNCLCKFTCVFFYISCSIKIYSY
jgi:hypothetical protein